MKNKTNYLILFFAGLMFGALSCNQPPTGKLTLSKTQFAPNEEIQLSFSAEGEFGAKPWIGIIPSDIPHGDEAKNDEHDLAYQYFDGITEGKLTFAAPVDAGSYDFRMNSSDENGVEVTSVTFTVVPSVVAVTLSLNKEEFSPGEEIIINYTAPADFADNAWIGIIPSETPHGSEATNDGADLAYEYLRKKTSGEMKFKVPDKPGSYDIRMNDSDNDGKEVASKTFAVK